VIGAEGYSASSPDEMALVNTAKYLGYEFTGRNNQDNSITIHSDDKPSIYHVL